MGSNKGEKEGEKRGKSRLSGSEEGRGDGKEREEGKVNRRIEKNRGGAGWWWCCVQFILGVQFSKNNKKTNKKMK